eukprot:4785795-Prymnesium_polylepis.1
MPPPPLVRVCVMLFAFAAHWLLSVPFERSLTRRCRIGNVGVGQQREGVERETHSGLLVERAAAPGHDSPQGKFHPGRSCAERHLETTVGSAADAGATMVRAVEVTAAEATAAEARAAEARAEKALSIKGA